MIQKRRIICCLCYIVLSVCWWFILAFRWCGQHFQIIEWVRSMIKRWSHNSFQKNDFPEMHHQFRFVLICVIFFEIPISILLNFYVASLLIRKSLSPSSGEDSREWIFVSQFLFLLTHQFLVECVNNVWTVSISLNRLIITCFCHAHKRANYSRKVLVWVWIFKKWVDQNWKSEKWSPDALAQVVPVRNSFVISFNCALDVWTRSPINFPGLVFFNKQFEGYFWFKISKWSRSDDLSVQCWCDCVMRIVDATVSNLLKIQSFLRNSPESLQIGIHNIWSVWLAPAELRILDLKNYFSNFYLEWNIK